MSKFIETLIHSAFSQNAQYGGEKIVTPFLVGFEDDHLNVLEQEVLQAIKMAGRRAIIVNAAGKSYLEICQMVTGRLAKTNFVAFESLEEFLFNPSCDLQSA